MSQEFYEYGYRFPIGGILDFCGEENFFGEDPYGLQIVAFAEAHDLPMYILKRPDGTIEAQNAEIIDDNFTCVGRVDVDLTPQQKQDVAMITFDL